MIRRITLFAALFFACAVSSNAQDYPTAEIFGGYSYLSIEGDELLGIDRQGLHGVGFSFAGNLTKSIGIVGDFSYNKKEFLDFDFFETDLKTFHFLFGPRFSYRGDTVTVFGHALVGGVNVKAEVDELGIEDSQTDFALGFGGGVDINLGRTFAIRAIQADYIPTRVDDFDFDKRWAHHYRVQAGIVIRLGN
jgi:hypothetical protein